MAKATNEETKAILSDKAWWQSFLPPNYKLHSWDYRYHADIYKVSPNGYTGPLLRINGAFMADVFIHHNLPIKKED